MKRAEIRANRERWIARLKNPESKKARATLATSEDTCCCLGHGCFELIPEHGRFDEHRKYYSFGMGYSHPPQKFMDMLGTWIRWGETSDHNYQPIEFNGSKYSDLTVINDCTPATLQEIGAYLESVIEGGPNTLFRPLTDFPE